MAKEKSKKPVPVAKARQNSPEAGRPKASVNSNPSDEKNITVVGLGASAGGLRALQAFFDSLPSNTGMAYVVVTHLHPEHESHLAELLQSHTRMIVESVSELVPIQPDRVYVLPPNRRVLMADSHLNLEEFDEPRGRRTPIDQFFRSLAASQSDAIGIILSGSGTDGSVGIRDIKENGGLLLVQSPEEAEYDDMPRAAISTGLADVILPVSELANRLVDYSSLQPALPDSPEELSKRELDAIERILSHVHARTGSDFSQYKRSTILRRIQRRMQINGFTSLESYLEYMREHGGEATAMFNDILIGVTNFFRDQPSWNALAQAAIPAIFDENRGSSLIRVWSIGCATGEEAHGLAILLSEQASASESLREIQIFASDLSEGSLVHAREGLYPTAIEADVSPERLERFFTREGNHYRINRVLRDMVLFTNHNLLRDPPFSHIDLIVCRNLLIYLNREVQESVFRIFHYALKPNGFLFLGTSESAESVPTLFAPVEKASRIYRSRSWRGELPHLPTLPLLRVSKEMKSDPHEPHRPVRALGQDIFAQYQEHATLLETYGPPSIVIDGQYSLLHLSDTVGRFLLHPQGAPTRDLLKLVRKELQPQLRTTLFQAFERNISVVSQPVLVQFDGSAHPVIISVHPRKSDDPADEKQALVVFLEDESGQFLGSLDISQAAQGLDSNAVIMQLENDVLRLREQLQGTLEEYNSSNEEMRASNEELQSINEEYRSTLEELETSKEELLTVNNELKDKVDELSRSNSDLENLMAASEISTLFLDRELHIKRFTSGMDKVLNLLPSDRGRPVSHLANNLGYDTLVEDAQAVLNTLAPIERDLQSKSDSWYQVRMRPYRTEDEHIDGVIVTFVDVTQIKEAQQSLLLMNQTLQGSVEERTAELGAANQRLTRLNTLFTTLFEFNPLPTSLNRLEDWEIINVNRAYLEYFGVPAQEVIGRSAIESGFASNAAIRQNLRQELERTGEIRDRELSYTRTLGGHHELRTIITSMQLIKLENEKHVISSFIDITERVRADQQVRALASDLTLAEQRERHRISQVLHDELQQRLFALRMQLTFLREETDENRLDKLKADLPQLETALAETIEITRNLSIELSPVILQGEGLLEAIRWLATQMEEKFGLKVHIDSDEANVSLRESLRVLIYQSVHELLFNVVKHAGVLEAQVAMQRLDDELRITVRDNGSGFDVSRLKPHFVDTHGLLNMQNKLTLLGCAMHIRSTPGNGTEVIIQVPLSLAEDSG